MPSYNAPLKDMSFVLHDVLKVEASETEGYSELSPDFTSAVLEEAGKISRDVLAPLNQVGDHEGCVLENGVVRTPTGFKDAFDMLKEGGWTGLDCDPEYGGQGMPFMLNAAVGEIMSSANMAFMMYSGLTHGAYSAIHAHGSDQQKETYLPNMVNCTWTGTMNLTEPHCGTDLGLLRTKAEPQDDGSFKITGQKIFISAGEHDMADNIIHLVLAKIPGGPDGVKGISLFIVPKFIVKDDGSLGDRNTLSCGKLEEKMGIHGNSTAVMNYDGATGYLLGTAADGLISLMTPVGQDGGKHVMAFFAMVKDFLGEHKENADLADFMEPLKQASKDLQAAGMFFMQNGMKNPNAALAGSTDFMHLFGHTCLGLMWARMAVASKAALDAGTDDPEFHENKLKTGRFYMSRLLPETGLLLKRIESGADPVMSLDAEAF